MTDLTPEQLELLNNSCSQCYKRGCSAVEATVRKLIRAAEQAAREKALREAAKLCRHGKTNRSGYAIERAILHLLGGKE